MRCDLSLSWVCPPRKANLIEPVKRCGSAWMKSDRPYTLRQCNLPLSIMRWSKRSSRVPVCGLKSRPTSRHFKCRCTNRLAWMRQCRQRYPGSNSGWRKVRVLSIRRKRSNLLSSSKARSSWWSYITSCWTFATSTLMMNWFKVKLTSVSRTSLLRSRALQSWTNSFSKVSASSSLQTWSGTLQTP